MSIHFSSIPGDSPCFSCKQKPRHDAARRDSRFVSQRTIKQPKDGECHRHVSSAGHKIAHAHRVFLAGVISVGISPSPLLAEAMTAVAFRSVAETCAPGVDPDLLTKIVATESGFEMFAIGVNGTAPRSYDPRSASEAAALARQLVSEGRSIDMGLGQINSANLTWLGLTPESVFDPCANLAATEAVLRDGYERSRKNGSTPSAALGQALSAYNTGSFTRGFANGYVARVLEHVIQPPSENMPPTRASYDAGASSDWDVFAPGNTPAASIFQ